MTSLKCPANRSASSSDVMSSMTSSGPGRLQTAQRGGDDAIAMAAMAGVLDAPAAAALPPCAPYACYLLVSLAPGFKDHTYIGFTVNPPRRIRQHNGAIAGGANRTRRKRPWYVPTSAGGSGRTSG